MSIQHAPLAVHEASSTMGCTVKCQLTRCCLSIVVKKNTIAGGLKYMCYLHDIFYPEYSLEAKPGVQYLHKTPVNGIPFVFLPDSKIPYICNKWLPSCSRYIIFVQFSVWKCFADYFMLSAYWPLGCLASGVYDDFHWVGQEGKNLAGEPVKFTAVSLKDCQTACDTHGVKPCLSIDFFRDSYICEIHQRNYLQAQYFFNQTTRVHYERNCSYQ